MTPIELPHDSVLPMQLNLQCIPVVFGAQAERSTKVYIERGLVYFEAAGSAALQRCDELCRPCCEAGIDHVLPTWIAGPTDDVEAC